MWPLSSATPDGRSGTGYRPPALGRRKLRRKTSFLCGSINVQSRTSTFTQPSWRSDPSGGPLFDRPKRGRKKPHQPALAHFVRVAGRDALRLTALARIGAANRNSLGHLRWPRSDIDSRNAPLRDQSVRDAAPRKARGKESTKEKRKQANGTALFRSTSRRASIGRRSHPATEIEANPAGATPARMNAPRGPPPSSDKYPIPSTEYPVPNTEPPTAASLPSPFPRPGRRCGRSGSRASRRRAASHGSGAECRP